MAQPLDRITHSPDIFRLSDERPASVNQRLSAVLREQREVLEAGALIHMRALPLTSGPL